MKEALRYNVFLLKRDQDANLFNTYTLINKSIVSLSELPENQKLTDEGLLVFSEGIDVDDTSHCAALLSVKDLQHRFEAVVNKAQTIPFKTNLQEWMKAINQKILQMSMKESEDTIHGAMLTGIHLQNETVVAFNIGNIGAFHYRRGRLIKLSCEHTQAQRMVRYGGVKQEKAMQQMKHFLLTQYIGIAPLDGILNPYVSEGTSLLPGDLILICSDKFMRKFSEENLTRLLDRTFFRNEFREKLKETIQQDLKGMWAACIEVSECGKEEMYVGGRTSFVVAILPIFYQLRRMICKKNKRIIELLIVFCICGFLWWGDHSFLRTAKDVQYTQIQLKKTSSTHALFDWMHPITLKKTIENKKIIFPVDVEKNVENELRNDSKNKNSIEMPQEDGDGKNNKFDNEPSLERTQKSASIQTSVSEGVEKSILDMEMVHVKNAALETPSETTETSSKEIETPSETPETTSKNTENPSQTPETTSQTPETTSKEIETPSETPENPSKTPETPSKTPETPSETPEF